MRSAGCCGSRGSDATAGWPTRRSPRILDALAQASVLVSGQTRIEASRDPSDDKFLIAAIEGRATYVVTGDRDLLDTIAGS